MNSNSTLVMLYLILLLFQPQKELNDDAIEHIQNSGDRDSDKKKISLRKRFFSNFRRLSENELGEDDSSSINEENSIEPKILTDEELLHKYWKLVVS